MPMESIPTSQLWTWLLAAASAIVLLSNAAEKIVTAVKSAKAPNARQDDRIAALEEWKTKDFANWQKEVDSKLNADLQHFNNLEEGNRAYCQALLALLDHGIDGNNIEQMQNAKKSLQQHLINR